MGLIIEVRENDGRVIGEAGESPPSTLLPLPSPDDASFPLMRGVDPYVDTTFSSVQMQWLLPELEALRKQAGGDDERRLIDEIISLARLCAEAPHRMLVFIGD